MTFDFYRGKKIFVTGHTGFKGSWLCKILSMAGAEVTGYALEASGEENLFTILDIEKNINSIIGDIRDIDRLKTAFDAVSPEIVFHLAAQPIVRESYKNPAYTYETNVMGTVNILECIRSSDCVRSFLNVTTDKVYKNNEWEWGYRENDVLDGYDPYSNSKSCSELVTHSYKRSFLNNICAVSTARAGNVIGGGDFAADRIIPDCVRAAQSNQKILLRNPFSVRPYQHVLEPLSAYLLIAERQYSDFNFADSYNVGPDDEDCIETGKLADIFCEKWGGQSWYSEEQLNAPHEANFLKLDCSKIKNKLGWKPSIHIDKTVEMTVDWFKNYSDKKDIIAFTEQQICDFMEIGR